MTEALVHIIEENIHDFVCKSIIYRFDLSCTIITDNRCQFNNAKFEILQGARNYLLVDLSQTFSKQW